MPMKPLDILKKGLDKYSKNIKHRKDEINAKLAQRETISSSNEQWLDNEGNIINEQCVMDALEFASDYEMAVGQLDEVGKAVVQRLREWAGDLPKVAGNKRKCKSLY